MPETITNSSIVPSRYQLPTLVLPDVLPTDVESLTTLLKVVIASHHEVTTKALEHMQHIIEQMILARRRMFGSSSEQLAAQGRLFDEAQVLAANTSPNQDIAPQPPEDAASAANQHNPEAKRKRGKRAPLPAELPRVNVLHDLPTDQRTCPCGTPMVLIGQDISEQLDIVPMQIRVLRHIRNRYGCPSSKHAPVTAQLCRAKHWPAGSSAQPSYYSRYTS